MQHARDATVVNETLTDTESKSKESNQKNKNKRKDKITRPSSLSSASEVRNGFLNRKPGILKKLAK